MNGGDEIRVFAMDDDEKWARASWVKLKLSFSLQREMVENEFSNYPYFNFNVNFLFLFFWGEKDELLYYK